MFERLLRLSLLALSLCQCASTLTTLQAEDGDLLGVIIRTRHTGYEGSGYGDYNDAGGGSIEWEYTSPAGGTIAVLVRYATQSKRPLSLSIDGQPVGTFQCETSGSWETWVEEELVVNVSPGSHMLWLEAVAFGPNVDSISILSDDSQGPGPTPAPTPSPTNRPTIGTSPGVARTYLAETAMTNLIGFATQHLGFLGTKYADFQNFGSYVQWPIRADGTSNYEVTVRFAAAVNRKCNLYIDGVKTGTFDFSGNGSWSSWRTETLIVFLDAGDHNLKILAEESTGPNIDSISIEPCEGLCLGLAFDQITSQPLPTFPPTPSPTVRATSPPTPSPSPQPTARPTQPSGKGGTTTYTPKDFPFTIVVPSGSKLERNEFRQSPNGQFEVGLKSDGDLILREKNGNVLWRAGTAPNGFRCFVQTDGNVIVRAENKKALWTSETYDHPGSRLIVDDGGRIAVADGDIDVWLEGVPRSKYTGPPGPDIQFPARGYFYYPWYPETWTVNGALVKFKPSVGLYSNSSPDLVRHHIDELTYGHADLTIASWWGPGTNQERGRLSLLMDELYNAGSDIKISVYHEQERDRRPQPAELRADLDYLKKWFAWHPAWGHVDGRPVIFAFNEEGCDVPERWMAASQGEWFVVLKLFPGYENCGVQPDNWHQYGVGGGDLEYDGISYTIAPGFWRADKNTPLVPRRNKQEWCTSVESMVMSKQPWQLVVSYNEHGEATGVESSPAWPSSSGYGFYLDCLNQFS